MWRHGRKIVPIIGAYLCAALMICAPLASHPFLQAATQTPAVRVSTKLIEVNVIVQDSKGEPVSGLTKDDFAVYDKGKRQEIAFFSEETNESVSTRSSAAAASPSPAVGTATFTNRVTTKNGGAPSITVILLDALNTQFTDMSYARAQVLRFLEQLRPQDRVAIYGLSTRLFVLHDFTSDVHALVNALQKSKNGESFQLQTSDTQDSDTGLDVLDEFMNTAQQHLSDFYVMNRVDLTARALKAIANQVAGLPGRKNLVWLSGSFPFQMGYDAQTTNIAGPIGSTVYGDAPALGGGKAASQRAQAQAGNAVHAPPPPDNSTERRNFSAEVESATNAVNDANVAIYPVDARGVMAPGGSANAISASAPTQNALNRNQGRPLSSTLMAVPPHENITTMETLADQTGGLAFYGNNDVGGSIRRAIDDSRVTYALAYYPENAKWDGSFRKIKVEVDKPGVELRYRRGYFAAASAADAGSDEQQLATEIASPLENTTIGLTVQAEPVDVLGARQLKVHLRIEANHLRFEQANGGWEGSLQLIWTQFAADGRVVDSTTQPVSLNLPQKSYEQVERSGMPLTGALAIKDDAVTLRLVCRDTVSGLMGSLNLPLKALK
jgi:VWFA-related protein